MDGKATGMGAYLKGIEAVPVHVEASIGDGLPGMTVTGMGDTDKFVLRERVRAVLLMSGIDVRGKSIVLKVSPEITSRCPGSIDLAAAAAILGAIGELGDDTLEGLLFYGELVLDGSARTPRGLYSASEVAHRTGRALVAHIDNQDVSPRAQIVGVQSVSDLLHLSQATVCKTIEDAPSYIDVAEDESFSLTEIVAATGCLGTLVHCGPADALVFGNHVRMLMGHPALGLCEEISRIWSAVGEPSPAGRPICYLDKSQSLAGVAGGGRPLRPGIVSTAHGGVLVADDLMDLSNPMVGSLKAITKHGVVRIARAEGMTELPADFTIVCRCSDPEEHGYGDIAAKRHLEKARALAAGLADIECDGRPGSYDFASASEMVKRGREFAAVHEVRDESLPEEAADLAHAEGADLACVKRIARVIADIREREEIDMDCAKAAVSLALRSFL